MSFNHHPCEFFVLRQLGKRFVERRPELASSLGKQS